MITSDGTRIISGSRDQTVRVWDAETGSNLLTLCGHSGDVKSVTVSHNETQIISGSDDGTVCFWDMRTGTLLQSFGDSPASINLVAISDDDSRVMAATYDGTIRVWNVQTGNLQMFASNSGLGRRIMYWPDWSHSHTIHVQTLQIRHTSMIRMALFT